MGWTGYPNTNKTAHELVVEEIEWGSPQRHKVVAHSGKYYAVENLQTGEVWGLVALIDRGDGEIATKLVDESMGPYETECPASVLNRLTEPAPNDYARQWRQKCRERLARMAKQPRLRPGDQIRFARPVEFRGGIEVSDMHFVGGFTFLAGHLRLKLPRNWKTRYEWELVAH
ncbi:hypothetical protein LCGC14_1616130 [marine sediment metagenome]|uniref:DUF6927 domain-containing protein n=1 Tax=marine sediment metagenome TaxID=412755 RepID=A0A0F9I750_9ZZZZ